MRKQCIATVVASVDESEEWSAHFVEGWVFTIDDVITFEFYIFRKVVSQNVFEFCCFTNFLLKQGPRG